MTGATDSRVEPHLTADRWGRSRSVPSVRVRPPEGRVQLNLRELWEYRELVYFLAWRDINVRYKQTLLGAGWAILQPLMAMLVFSLFFGRLAGMPSDGLPYPLFAYAALVPWTFFAYALDQSANSLVTNSQIVTKVYFPRAVVPIASVLSGLLDFALAFLVLLGMMAFYGIAPTPNLLWLPAFLLLALTTALGVGLWLSALNVMYRDVRYTVPFLIQIWLFATPVVYPSSLLSESWRTVYGINPMVGVVEGFRWALLGVEVAPTGPVLVSAAAAIMLLTGGLFYFRRVENIFADVM